MLQVRAGSELSSSSDKGTSMQLRVRDAPCKGSKCRAWHKGNPGIHEGLCSTACHSVFIRAAIESINTEARNAWAQILGKTLTNNYGTMKKLSHF